MTGVSETLEAASRAITRGSKPGRDLEEFQRWRNGHDQYHKERLAKVKANEGRKEERFRSLESEVRKIDNLAYRIAAAEQTTASTAAAIKGLQALVSAQSHDIKVIREILQRIEAGQRGGIEPK